MSTPTLLVVISWYWYYILLDRNNNGSIFAAFLLHLVITDRSPVPDLMSYMLSYSSLL
jgi:hypothetical protein